MTAAVTTDEIFDRYLKKAIVEINRLSDEISKAAAERVPVLPSGHPLASIFLLKHSPQPQELQPRQIHRRLLPFSLPGPTLQEASGP